MPEEIDEFLAAFHTKLKIWGVVFRDDRGKNTQALLDLEITPDQRKKILGTITRADFSEGPLEDTLHRMQDMWVFGKTIKSKEIYIKITLGFPGTETICISFHVSEHTMTFPNK